MKVSPLVAIGNRAVHSLKERTHILREIEHEINSNNPGHVSIL
jgi:hypothetical protein